MKCSLGISKFSWRDLSSFPFYCFPLFLCSDLWGRLSYLSLLFFGTLHSHGYIFPLLLYFLLPLFSQLFVRSPQTATFVFCISFSWGWSWVLSPIYLGPNYGGLSSNDPMHVLQHSVSPTLQQATTDPGLHRRILNTHRQVRGSLLWGRCSFLLGPGAQVSVVPAESISQSCGSSGSSMVGLVATSSRGLMPYPGLVHPEPLSQRQTTTDSYFHR